MPQLDIFGEDATTEIRSVDGLPMETDPMLGEDGIVRRAIFSVIEKLLSLLK